PVPRRLAVHGGCRGRRLAPGPRGADRPGLALLRERGDGGARAPRGRHPLALPAALCAARAPERRMIPTANLLAFGLTSIPLIVVPGPSVLFTIGRSLSLGRVGGLLSVLGNAAGAFVISAAIAFGLGTLLEESVVAFTIVKVL